MDETTQPTTTEQRPETKIELTTDVTTDELNDQAVARLGRVMRLASRYCVPIEVHVQVSVSSCP